MSWVTTNDAANRLGVTRQRVGQMVRAGELEGLRVGARGWQVSLASVQERAHLEANYGRPWSADTLRDVVEALSTGERGGGRAADLIERTSADAIWRKTAQLVTVHRFFVRHLDRVREHISRTGESALDALPADLVGESRALHGYLQGVRLSELATVADVVPSRMLSADAQRFAGNRGGEVAIHDIKGSTGAWVTAPVAQRALVAADCARSTTTRVHSAGLTALTEMRAAWLRKNT